MGLLPLAEDAEGVVCSTATAWFGSVTLGFLQSTAIAGLTYSLADAAI
jgi:hypothetical protein